MENIVLELSLETSKLKQATDEVLADQKQFTTEVQKSNQQIAASSAPVIDANKKMSDTFREISQTVATGGLKEYVKDLTATTEKHIGLRAQLIQVKNALFELADAGKKGTAEYQALYQKAEQLATASRQLTKELSNLGSQTKVLAGLTDAARGVAAGFQLATVAVDAFGGSSKDNQETIKKVVESMAVLQALTELQLLTNEESAAMQLVMKGQRLANVAAIQLETAVQSENIIVSKAATAAQWLLNLAMEANPVLLLIGAIGALVAVFMLWTNATGEAIKAQKELNEVNQAYLDYLTKINEYQKRDGEELVKSAERHLAHARAIGASNEEIRQAEAEVDKAREKSSLDQVTRLGNEIAEYERNKEGIIKNRNELTQRLKEIEIAQAEKKPLTIDGIKYKGDNLDKLKENVKAELDIQNNAEKLITEVRNNAIEAVSKSLDNETIRNKKRLEETLQNAKANFEAEATLAEDASNKQLQAKIGALQKQKELDLLNTALTDGQKLLIEAKYLKDVENLNREYQKSLQERYKEIIDTRLAQAKEGSEAELSLKIQDIQRQANIEIIAAKQNEDLKLKIRAETEKKISKAREDFENKSAHESLDIEIALEKTAQDKMGKLGEEGFQSSKKLLQLEAKAQIQTINEQVHSEEYKAAKIGEINAKLEADLEALDKQRGLKKMQSDLDDINRERRQAANKLSGIEGDPYASEQTKFAAKQEFHNKNLDLIADEMDKLDDSYNKDLVNYDDYLKKKGELDDVFRKEQKQRDNEVAANKLKDEKSAVDATFKIAKQVSDTIFQIESSNRQAELDGTLSKLEKQKERELSNKDLTEAQKRAIDEKYHKKEAAEKLKAWKAEQAAKEEQAIINGALAITNILATMPWTTFGIAQAIAITEAAVTTALQVGIIASQKPPQFAKGTSSAPEGYAIVGEQGKELIYDKGKMSITGDQAQLTYLNEGAKVITHPETMKILEKYSIPTIDIPEAKNFATITTTQQPINYQLLAKAFADELEKSPRTQLSFDQNGFTHHIISKYKKTQRLNTRYP